LLDGFGHAVVAVGAGAGDPLDDLALADPPGEVGAWSVRNE
jgi:hypothetical protein